MAVAVRRASYGIDTALLTAALTLMHIPQLNPLQAGWLGPSWRCLLLYIVLGMALKRARTCPGGEGHLSGPRCCAWVTWPRLRAHSPWGIFAAWLSI